MAVPVSGSRVVHEIVQMVDEGAILEKPLFFQAVTQVYRNWCDVLDDEVIEKIKRWEANTD